MKNILFILLIFTGFSGFSQETAKIDTLNYTDKNGLRQGKWIMGVLNEDSLIGYEMKCYYIDGKLSGPWVSYNSDSLPEDMRAYFKGKMMKQTKIVWYDNGNMKSSISFAYINNEKVNDGERLLYYESGVLEKKSIYNKGKADGKWEGYYENGKVKYSMLYENGSYKSYTEYDESGNLKK